MATVAALTECARAILLFVGLLTRAAALLLVVEMLIVFVKVNWVTG